MVVRLFKTVLAQFAFQELPVVGEHILAFFKVDFTVEPFSQAVEMNGLHSARACAWRDKWVLAFFFWTKADSAGELSFVRGL